MIKAYQDLSPFVRRLLLALVVGISYYLAARLSLNLALVHGQVTPIWPPTGIALVAMLVWGKRIVPAIFASALCINIPLGPSLLGASFIAFGNTLAPFVAVVLLEKLNFDTSLERLRDALAIVLIGALGGMTISATMGSGVLLFSNVITVSSFWSTWAVWWTGDAMGVLLVAPFLLSLLPHSERLGLTWRQGGLLAILLLFTALITALMFTTSLHLEYLVLPLIMLSAWRFHQRGATIAALIASFLAIYAAIHSLGPFRGEDLFTKMVTLQAFNVSVALASFVLASFVVTLTRKEELTRLYMTEHAANEAKSAFLNMVAHELRTPLGVVAGYLSMLSDGSLGDNPQNWKPSLEILIAKTAELNKIVSDLLDASRIEAKVLTCEISRLDLCPLISRSVERARARAQLLGGKLELECSLDEIWVDADPTHVERIMDNLINNALNYTLEKPHVGVRLRYENEKAIVEVSDNGIGIPPDQIEMVFDRFHRSHDPNLVNVFGTGLGLYISRQMATALGGRLVILSSVMGKGTTFEFSLPLSNDR